MVTVHMSRITKMAACISSVMQVVTILMVSLVTYNAANADDRIPLVRGVELKLQPFFSPDRDFTCLDGSRSIPFASVNDDYCDCADGTDEPGTSACPEGRYYCYNHGYKPKYIPSSRVNDGICDCCDGSDEYDSSVVCFNECEKYGLAEAELRKEEMAETIEGSKVRKEYIQSGKEKKDEKKKRIETINELLEQRRKELELATASKETAEAPEKEAKDKHLKEWEEQQAKKKAEEDSAERNAAFDVLDVDKDGWISIGELGAHNNMESDMDEAEAQKMLGGETMVDREGIVNVWKNIKPKYRKDGRPDPSQFDESNQDEPPPEAAEEKEKKEEEKTTEGEFTEDIALKSHSTTKLSDISDAERTEREMNKIYGEDDYDEEDDRGDYKGVENHSPDDDDSDDDDDDDDDDNDKDYDDDKGGDGDDEYKEESNEYREESKEAMPDYHDDVKQLIEVADKARAEFDTIDKTVKQLETEKKDIEDYMVMDFGSHEEFSALKGECYELTDREYTYKLCPFDRITQKDKDGGGPETNLGNKMTWVGKGTNRYYMMKYDGGQTCWNGPARSTTVHLSCGKENRLMTVHEPSRCEYEMTFKTPSLCEHTEHDEL